MLESDVLNVTILKLLITIDENGNEMVLLFQQHLPRLMFLKHGGHTGTIGALINSVQKFTIDRDAPSDSSKPADKGKLTTKDETTK